jgi:transcriptional regulator with XRE-family HTH domain
MEKNSKIILAENLSRLMLENNLNQVELAKKSTRFGGGVNQKTISNYLDRSIDSMANPCLKKIEALAKCFKLQTHQILDENLFKEQPKAMHQIDSDRLDKSISEGALLLFEAGIIDKEKANVIVGLSRDISKAAGIIYSNLNEDSNNKIVFDFVSYLNARKASNLD